MKNLVILLIFFCSCSKSINTNDLIVNQLKWTSTKRANYEFTLRINCYCLVERTGPHVIKVIDGKIVTVNNLPYDVSKTGPLMTIDELIEYIKTSLAKNPYTKKVEYNPNFGYPEHVFFDFVKEMVDEEIGFDITDYKEITR